jgi:Polyketide cyclase / dehydrase and lipid transport
MRSTFIRAIVFGGVLLLSAYLLIKSGVYGVSLFLFLPVAIGGFAAWMVEPETEKAALLAGAVGGFSGSLLLLFIGAEGLVCIIMVLPIVVPLGAVGGFLAYEIRMAKDFWKGSKRAGLLLLLPVSLAWDLNATNPLFEVRTSIEINASPETVWRNVVSFSDLPEPEEWYFQAGIAYPKRARIEGSGPHAIRYCEFSTGPFVEPIEVWQEPTLLRFNVTQNPPPMEEWSPYRNVTPRHLHGYLISKKGQFRLTRLANGRTLLEGTTWYQHGLRPAQYWRLWSDAIIHRIHLRVLNHIRNLSEPEQSEITRPA